MNPFDFFDKIYFINLDERKDRLEKVSQEFSKIKINPIRFSAIKRNNFTGCYLSHLEIISLAKKNNFKNILILEDDVKFINNPLEILSIAITQLPETWNMFYLGGNICKRMTKIGSHLAKLSHAQSTHAYAVNSNFYTEILKHTNMYKHIDQVYAEDIIPQNLCYITIPMIAIQETSYSNIENKVVNYESWMEKRFWEQLK